MNAADNQQSGDPAVDPFTQMVDAFTADREDLALAMARTAADSGQRYSLAEVADLLGIDLDAPDYPGPEEEPPTPIYSDDQIRNLLAVLGWTGELRLVVNELDDFTATVDAATTLGLLPAGIEVEVPDMWHGAVDLRLPLGPTKTRTYVELDVDGYLRRPEVREPGPPVAKARHLLTYIAAAIVEALADFADYYVPTRSRS